MLNAVKHLGATLWEADASLPAVELSVVWVGRVPPGFVRAAHFFEAEISFS